MKLIYEKISGDVALSIKSTDSAVEADIAKWNARPEHGVFDAPGLVSADAVRVGMVKGKPGLLFFEVLRYGLLVGVASGIAVTTALMSGGSHDGE